MGTRCVGNAEFGFDSRSIHLEENRMKKSVQEGGCWYCGEDDEDLDFTVEFDAYVHLKCVQNAVNADPNDREAQIILKDIT